MNVRFSAFLGYASLAALVVLTILLQLMGDRVWWTVPLLFGPRWVATPLLLGFLPMLRVAPWRGFLLLTTGTALLLFGILDLRLGLGRFGSADGIPVRVLELNAEGVYDQPEKTARIVALIRETRPDLIVMVECGPEMLEVANDDLGDYDVRTERALCFLSRGTIDTWEVRDSRDLPGQSGAIARAIVQTDAGVIRVGIVHLATPRHALDRYADLSGIPRQGPATDSNRTQRTDESRAARGWIFPGDSLPTIVAGDFNLPVESAIYRRYWGDLSNALSRTGVGLLATKHTRWWGTRIDHVLGGLGVRPVRARVAPTIGSDHRPVVADLLLPPAR